MVRYTIILLVLGLAACAGPGGNEPVNAAAGTHPTLDGGPPLVIAHRGASGQRPEHTIAAYELAIDMGADYIEPDLVITSDGQLVARHDRYLSTTTDVSERPEFAARRRHDEELGRGDWFVEEFTLAELKTLRARQPFEGRPKEYDGRFEVPTFDEVMALAARRSAETGRRIGVYPETKKPGYFKSIGLDFEVPLLDILARHGYGKAGAPVFIQSFEPEILENLRAKTDLPLILLVYPKREDDPAADPLTPNIPLKEAARIADGVGPDKSLLLSEDGVDTGFVARAHELGLAVHPWTFRADRLPERFATPEEELAAYFRLGVDGIFTDFPDLAVAARDSFRP